MITVQVYPAEIRIPSSSLENMAEVLKVKRLPGRVYDGSSDEWVIPIRPGLARAFEAVFSCEGEAEVAAELLRDGEAEFLRLLEPPPAGSVDIWKVSAQDATELATLFHFYDVHDGDRGHYARVHYPFVMGE